MPGKAIPKQIHQSSFFSPQWCRDDGMFCAVFFPSRLELLECLRNVTETSDWYKSNIPKLLDLWILINKLRFRFSATASPESVLLESEKKNNGGRTREYLGTKTKKSENWLQQGRTQQQSQWSTCPQFLSRSNEWPLHSYSWRLKPTRLKWLNCSLVTSRGCWFLSTLSKLCT